MCAWGISIVWTYTMELSSFPTNARHLVNLNLAWLSTEHLYIEREMAGTASMPVYAIILSLWCHNLKLAPKNDKPPSLKKVDEKLRFL